MLSALSAIAAGLLFGLGLIVSRMVDPAKVIGFLDIFGDWDPSLALVMGGAVAVSALGYAVADRFRRPLLAPGFKIPARRGLDARLMSGAAIFGVGWGLVGLCPGPTLVALSFAPRQILPFVAAMLAGMLLCGVIPSDRRQHAPERVLLRRAND